MGHVLLPTYLSMLTWAAPTFWLLGASTPLNIGVQCLSESLIPIHLAVRPEVGLLGHGVLPTTLVEGSFRHQHSDAEVIKTQSKHIAERMLQVGLSDSTTTALPLPYDDN